ncbi:hypothetical protein HFO27_13495 [Rhizobium leguminosarum]|nr:hypothetical protein [Rhizobium leguminosarum]MBY3175646.1 hypothetical protein [Rhizobium leguminosarum]
MAEKMSAAARKILKMRAKAIGYLAFFAVFTILFMADLMAGDGRAS